MDKSLSGRVIGRAGRQFRGVIERVKVAEYAQALHLRNPIHLDRAAAVAKGYRDIVVPVGFLNIFTLQPRTMKFETFDIDENNAIAGEWGWDCRLPICVGDELHGQSVLADISQKQGKRPMDVLVIHTTFLNDKNEIALITSDTTLAFREA